MKTSCRKILGSFVAAGVLALGAAAARGDVIIDSFEYGYGFPVIFLGSYNFVSIGKTVDPVPQVIGGRGFELGPITSVYPATDSITVSVGNAGSKTFLDFEATTGAAGNFSLNYGIDFEGMHLPIDGTTDILRLTFLTYNHAGSVDMQIDARLETGLFTNTVVTYVSRTISASGPQSVDFSLNSLGGGKLDSMSLFFDAPPGTSFELSSVRVVSGVPEPSSLALISIPALLLLRRHQEVRL